MRPLCPSVANASKAASNLYAKFGYAAESYLLSTFPDATSQHFGRASRITFKKVKVSLANENGHIYTQPCVSLWEHLGSRLRLFKGPPKNGSDTTPDFQETCEALQRMQNDITKNWPAGQKLLPSEVTAKLGALLLTPTITGTAELVHVANATLARSITEQTKHTSEKYREARTHRAPTNTSTLF